jgi:hypothetical protein
LSRFRGLHWLAILWLWAGLLPFLAHILAATIQVGHLPVYDQPDPKAVAVPGLYHLAVLGMVVAVVGLPFLFVMSMLRPFMAPRTRDGRLTMTLSVVGILLTIALITRFSDWIAD